MHSSEPQLPAALAAGLPAALLQQLQPVNVVKLMQAALTAEQQQGALQQVQAALGLPAAQVPDADSVCSLLQQAVRHPEEGLVAALCGLPGAQLMDAQSICSLLAGALESGGYQKVQALVRLPAAQSSTADALMPLASAAARTSEQQSLLALLWLPAASTLSGAAIDDLLQAVAAAARREGTPTHACTVERVRALCGLPGAAAASTATLLAALDAVIIISRTCCCFSCQSTSHSVCKLLAGQQPGMLEGELAGVLQAAYNKQRCYFVWPLLDTPQALQLQEQLVLDCVLHVLQNNKCSQLGTLVSLDVPSCFWCVSKCAAVRDHAQKSGFAAVAGDGRRYCSSSQATRQMLLDMHRAAVQIIQMSTSSGCSVLGLWLCPAVCPPCTCRL